MTLRCSRSTHPKSTMSRKWHGNTRQNLSELRSAQFSDTSVTHYNRGRPHASLGPGFPEAAAAQNSLVARAITSLRDAEWSRRPFSVDCITSIAGCQRPRDGRINFAEHNTRRKPRTPGAFRRSVCRTCTRSRRSAPALT
jgi:hypothetical protein